MPYRQNTFEGGTDAVTITTGNSGGASGQPWDSVIIDAGATAAFSTTRASQGNCLGKVRYTGS
jgi:hypothetical protein